MKLSAIFQANGQFLGVLETARVEELAKRACITDFRQVDGVVVEQRSTFEDDEEVVYRNAFEQIEDLHGGRGNTVLKVRS